MSIYPGSVWGRQGAQTHALILYVVDEKHERLVHRMVDGVWVPVRMVEDARALSNGGRCPNSTLSGHPTAMDSAIFFFGGGGACLAAPSGCATALEFVIR